MKVTPNKDCLHEFWVESESDGGKQYLVRLGAYPIGLNDNGAMRFNGACICTKTDKEWFEFGCENFRFDKEPKLKNPDNMGKVFRCKHIRAAMEVGFEMILPHLVATDKNLPDHQMP